jgi:hypothetical protein
VTTALDVKRSAVISDDGLYRYRLDRWWGDDPRLAFCMLNPSTADADVDDRTIGRCIAFARREGYDGITVVNLFAWRSTDPDNLPISDVEAVGPANLIHLLDAAAASEGRIVVAWGAHKRVPARGGYAVHLLRNTYKVHLDCLGVTKSGAPRHPLYVRGDQPLIPYPAGATT